MEFKDRLKQYRQDNNLTQDELADKLYVSRQAISKYETGRGYPSIDVLTDIAKLMGISVDELLTREELVNETQRMTETLRRNNKRAVVLSACATLIVIVLVVSVILLAIGMTSGFDTYKVPSNHCIVGLSTSFQLYSDSEGKLCEPIEQNIKGIDKDAYENWNTNFYSVIKGAEYTIVVDSLADKRGGFGPGIYGSWLLGSYWEGLVITCFKKTYSEDSGLQDEVFFETNYKQINDEVKVTFNQNCIVEVDVENYLYVGGIYEITEKGSDRLDGKIYDLVSEDGKINDTDGLYYIFLNERAEVCVHQDAWKTNLEVTDYNYEYFFGGRGTGIRAQFTAKQPVVADNEELCLYTLCRTVTHKYFIYPTAYIDAAGFTLPVRENELQLSFEK